MGKTETQPNRKEKTRPKTKLQACSGTQEQNALY
jgi:hypothetical protein